MWQILFCLLAFTAAVPDDDDHFESAEIKTYVQAVPAVVPVFKATFQPVQQYPTAAEYRATADTGFTAGETPTYNAAQAPTYNTGEGQTFNTGEGQTFNTGEGQNYNTAAGQTYNAAAPTDVEVTHVEPTATNVKPTGGEGQFFVKVDDDDDDDFKVAFTPGQFRSEGGKTPIFYKKFSAEVDDDDYYKFKLNPTFRTTEVKKSPVFFKRSVEFDDDFVVAAPTTQFRSAGAGARTPVFFRKFSAEIDDDDYYRPAAIRPVPIPYTAGGFRTAGTAAVPLTYSVGNYRFKYDDDDDDDRRFFFRTAGTAAAPLTYSAGYRYKYDDDDDLFDDK